MVNGKTLTGKALVRFSAPHFTAGAEFDLDSKRFVRAAPIIRWMQGKSWRDIKPWLERRGVTWQVVEASV